jgi:hypothetical protein
MVIRLGLLTAIFFIIIVFRLHYSNVYNNNLYHMKNNNRHRVMGHPELVS